MPRKCKDVEGQGELLDMLASEPERPSWDMASEAVQSIVDEVVRAHFAEALDGKPVVAMMNLAENVATPVEYQGVANWLKVLAQYYGADEELPFGVLFIHEASWVKMKATECKVYVYHALKYGIQNKDGTLVEGRLPLPDESEDEPHVDNAQQALTEAARDLCPKQGDGIESVTFSTPGQEPVVLTADTRRKIEGLLRESEAEAGQLPLGLKPRGLSLARLEQPQVFPPPAIAAILRRKK